MGNCSCVDSTPKTGEVDTFRPFSESPLSSYYQTHSDQLNNEVRSLFEEVLKGKARAVTSVSFVKRKLSTKDCQALSMVFAELKSMTSLTLNDNDLSPSKLQLLLDNLPAANLVKLAITNNQLRDEGCELLMNKLKLMQSLEELDLTGNKITHNYVNPLCEALAELTRLRVLNLRKNLVTNRGLKKIARCLQSHIEMSEFLMDSVELSQDDVAEIRAILPLAALV